MPTINNENVSTGDRVYDIAQGYGTVVSTMFNAIQVHFDTNVRITFDSDGHYGGVRRLYWHNPVVIEPPKHKTVWDTLSGVMGGIHDLLKNPPKP